MGKRELLLIVGFAVMGAVVYQFTAPPPRPGERGFSPARIIDHIRREVHGNPGSKEITTSATRPVAASTSELRIRIRSGEVTVTGEDRQDIGTELHVWSSGYDEAEAERLAKATTLKMDEAGGIITASLTFPPEARQRATVRFRVPARLRVRLEPYAGQLQIFNVAGVELVESRGEAQIRGIAGRVAAAHRGGDLTIEQAESVKLNVRGSDVRVKQVRGDANLQLVGGELRGETIGGPIELESSSVDVLLEKLEKTKGSIRITATAGTITLRALRTDARIDGRNAEIDVTIDQAAPLTIYNDGDEDIELTLPPDGFHLDALATDGRITLPDGILDVTTTQTEQRAIGPVGGGGPAITLRANRGNISLRASERAR